MNAPVVLNPRLNLEALKADRAVIRARLASINERRATLGEAEVAVDEARKALVTFADHHANRIDDWTRGGCKGPRPTPALGEHAALEAKATRAIHAAGTNRTALNTLAEQEAEATHALSAIGRPIQISAVGVMGEKLDVLSDETVALRTKLTANEALLFSAHNLLRELGKTTDHRGLSNFDAPIYDRAMRIRGVKLPTREEACPVDAASTKYWQSMLDDLSK